MPWFIFTLGAINALIPLMIILILIAAAAGSTRGASIFEVFGISSLIGIGGGQRGTLSGKGISKTTTIRKGVIRKSVSSTLARPLLPASIGVGSNKGGGVIGKTINNWGANKAAQAADIKNAWSQVQAGGSAAAAAAVAAASAVGVRNVRLSNIGVQGNRLEVAKRRATAASLKTPQGRRTSAVRGANKDIAAAELGIAAETMGLEGKPIGWKGQNAYAKYYNKVPMKGTTQKPQVDVGVAAATVAQSLGKTKAQMEIDQLKKQNELLMKYGSQQDMSKERGKKLIAAATFRAPQINASRAITYNNSEIARRERLNGVITKYVKEYSDTKATTPAMGQKAKLADVEKRFTEEYSKALKDLNSKNPFLSKERAKNLASSKYLLPGALIGAGITDLGVAAYRKARGRAQGPSTAADIMARSGKYNTNPMLSNKMKRLSYDDRSFIREAGKKATFKQLGIDDKTAQTLGLDEIRAREGKRFKKNGIGDYSKIVVASDPQKLGAVLGIGETRAQGIIDRIQESSTARGNTGRMSASEYLNKVAPKPQKPAKQDPTAGMSGEEKMKYYEAEKERGNRERLDRISKRDAEKERKNKEDLERRLKKDREQRQS